MCDSAKSFDLFSWKMWFAYGWIRIYIWMRVCVWLFHRLFVCPVDADANRKTTSTKKFSISNFHYFELTHALCACVKVLMPHSFHFFHFSLNSRQKFLTFSSLAQVHDKSDCLDGRSIASKRRRQSNKNGEREKIKFIRTNIFDVIFFKSIQIPFYV